MTSLPCANLLNELAFFSNLAYSASSTDSTAVAEKLGSYDNSSWSLLPGSAGYYYNSFFDIAAFAAFDAATDSLVISFRGSDPHIFTDRNAIINWLQDAGDINLTYDEFEPFISSVDKFISSNPNINVYVTGHSLGGAMADLFMYFHPNTSETNYVAITFESPGFLALGLVYSGIIYPPQTDPRVTDFLIAGDPVADLSPYDPFVLPSQFVKLGIPLTVQLSNDPGIVNKQLVFEAVVQAITSSPLYKLANTNTNIVVGDTFTVANGQASQSASNDLVVGQNGESNLLLGLGGNDTLEGGTGNNLLDGGSGSNQLIGGGGDNIFGINEADDAQDTIIAKGDGNDLIEIFGGDPYFIFGSQISFSLANYGRNLFVNIDEGAGGSITIQDMADLSSQSVTLRLIATDDQTQIGPDINLEQEYESLGGAPPPSVTWSGPSSTDLSGDWNTAANWSSGNVPTVADYAALGGDSTYTVMSTQDVQLDQLNIEDPLATLAIGSTLAIEGYLNNAGNIDVDGGGNLTLDGTINNIGSITLDGHYHSAPYPYNYSSTAALLINGVVSLEGGGQVPLRNDRVIDDAQTSDYYGNYNSIGSASASATLVNVDNILSGGGQIGDGNMTLVNQAGGVIEATQSPTWPYSSLTLNTGSNTITNAGLMEAVGGATLQFYSAVINTGTIEATGGSTVVLLHDVSGGAGRRLMVEF